MIDTSALHSSDSDQYQYLKCKFIDTLAENKNGSELCEIKCVQIYLNINGEMKYVCDICHKIIIHTDVINHVQNHFGTLPHKCDMCNIEFIEYEPYLRHLYLHQENIVHRNTTNSITITSSSNSRMNKETVARHQQQTGNILEKQKDNINTKPNIKIEHHHLSSTIKNNNKFLCYYCNKEFPDPHIRLQHLISHIKNIHKCLICGKVFQNKMQLYGHMRIHSNKPKQRKKLHIYGQPNETLNTMKAETMHTCDICKEEFSNKNLFIKHILEHKSGALPYNIVEPLIQELPENYHSEIQADTYKCTICGKCFAGKYNLYGHMSVHTVKKDTVNDQLKAKTIDFYKCSVCGKFIAGQNNIYAHMRNHTNEKQKETIISSNRNDERELIGIKETDKKIASNICDICQESFECENTFNKHIMDHRIGIIPPIGSKRNRNRSAERRVCPICGKSLSNIGNLNKHMVVHTGERKSECHICKKQFSQSNYLRTHILIHTKELPYKCTICERRFRVSGARATHMLRHNNIRRHACTFCDKKFFDGDQLRCHNRTHTGEKPYQCDVCKEYFRTRYCMLTHRRLHTGEKPYKCDNDYCQKHFAQLSGKHNHMKYCKISDSAQNN